MTKIALFLSPNQRWLLIFGFWLLFLSGIFSNFVGSPGIAQAIRLRSLLLEKTQQLARAQDELQKLHLEASQLEHNRTTQEREIRKVLGYAAADELVFDFSLDE